MEKDNYKQFGITMLISFCVMYLVMFLNIEKTSHLHLSLSRTYMTLLMISPMAILMLFRMKKMFPDKKTNITIVIGSISVFVLSLWLLRTQTPVSDLQYMKAMIPHHSSAIMTSENAKITDPEVKQMSEEIIKAQQEEIARMEKMIARLNNK